MVDLVSRGLGVAVLSPSTVAGRGDALRAVPIDDVEAPAVLALIWNASPNPSLHELVRQARDAFEPGRRAASQRERA